MSSFMRPFKEEVYKPLQTSRRYTSHYIPIREDINLYKPLRRYNIFHGSPMGYKTPCKLIKKSMEVFVNL